MPTRLEARWSALLSMIQSRIEISGTALPIGFSAVVNQAMHSLLPLHRSHRASSVEELPMHLSLVVPMTKPLLKPMILFHIVHRRLDHRFGKKKVHRSDIVLFLLNGALCGFAD